MYCCSAGYSANYVATMAIFQLVYLFHYLQLMDCSGLAAIPLTIILFPITLYFDETLLTRSTCFHYLKQQLLEVF